MTRPRRRRSRVRHSRTGDRVGEHPADEVAQVLLELDRSDPDPAAAIETGALPARIAAPSSLTLKGAQREAAEPAADQPGEGVGATLARLAARRRERHEQRSALALGDDRVPRASGNHHALVLAQPGNAPRAEDRPKALHRPRAPSHRGHSLSVPVDADAPRRFTQEHAVRGFTDASDLTWDVLDHVVAESVCASTPNRDTIGGQSIQG
jgi:hypothetical protein